MSTLEGGRWGGGSFTRGGGALVRQVQGVGPRQVEPQRLRNGGRGSGGGGGGGGGRSPAGTGASRPPALGLGADGGCYLPVMVAAR